MKQLSENLLNPTKAKLRQECLYILKNRYLSKDDEVISAFFNAEGKYENHEISISKFDLDGFKALQKFLMGQPDIRRDETIKLLAWLIDFEPRPYVFGDTYNHQEEIPKKDEIKEEIDPPNEDIVIEKPTPPIKNKKPTLLTQKKKQWQLIFGIMLAISLITSALYIFPLTSKEDNETASNDAAFLEQNKKVPVLFVSNPEQKTSKKLPSTKTNKDCMYWLNDHYVAINCNKNIRDTAKFVLDQEKVDHFKKINNPDTLTKNSIGKIYYVKINGTIEYYTSSGFHPIYIEKKLKPLTAYMLNKYIISLRP